MTVSPSVLIDVTGARGEGFGEIARRVGSVGGVPVPPTATDADVLALLQSSYSGVVAAAPYTLIAPVVAATTANITLSGAQTIDGVNVAAADRVLVKNQTTGAANGIYVAAAGAWTRATDFDGAGEVVAGAYVRVLGGTANAGAWVLTTPNPITVGTTAQTWLLFDPDVQRLIVADNGKTVRQRFSNSRQISLFDFMTNAQIADVLDGTPTLDVAQSFQDMIDYCDFYQYTAWIPEVFALLGKRINQRPRVRVMSDANGTLKWTNTADCGWHVFGTDSGDRPGYCRVELPQLIGPNDISGYENGSKIYSVAGFLGTALHVEDCIWSDFKIQQQKGWGTYVKMSNTTMPTDNNYFELGTGDLCKYGIYIENPVGATHPVGQSRFRTMNLFALYPVYIKALAGSIGVFECDIDALGMTVAETGGTTIYVEGNKSSDMRIRGKAANMYAASDSPAGTPTGMRGPIVGGNGVSPSGETGWALGTRNHFTLHLHDLEPAAGDPIAIKMGGPGSVVDVSAPKYAASNPYTVKAMSSTQGEANYNGGVGGAALHPLTRVKFNVTALGAGSNQTFYFYHQRLNADNIVPLEIVQLDNNTDLQIRTENNGPVVPREAKVVVHNPTGAPITQEVNLWIRV